MGIGDVRVEAFGERDGVEEKNGGDWGWRECLRGDG